MASKINSLLLCFFGSLVLSFILVMLCYVSFNILGPTIYFIAMILGYIIKVYFWRVDSKFEQGIEQFPAPAETILEKCKKKGAPYAVYLRSFNYERLQNPFPIPFLRQGNERSARLIEILLIKILNGRLPVLALSDPHSPFSIPGAHRFRRPPTSWPIFVEDIMRDSSLIILYIAECNPGLEFEIELICELGFTDKALVITKSDDFKYYSDFRWALKEDDPQLATTLNEIVKSLNYAYQAKFADKLVSATEDSEISHVSRRSVRQSFEHPRDLGAKAMLWMAVRVLVFLLPLIVAFKVWIVPNILSQFYSPMIEIRKSQDNIRELPGAIILPCKPIYNFNCSLPIAHDNSINENTTKNQSKFRKHSKK